VSMYHVAQLNVARALAPMDSPRLAEFVSRLDEINHLGDGSPGFVWRLQGAGGTSVELQVGDDPLYIVNLTVWESIDDLFDFTYRSDHKTVFKRRFDWFERFGRPSACLWWQRAGTLPAVEDAERRLRQLHEHGPTVEAFTFKHRFPAPNAIEGDDA
jgi:hypothetical protein